MGFNLTRNEILFLLATIVAIVLLVLYFKYNQPRSVSLSEDTTAYKIRNGTLYTLYVYNANNVLLGSLGGWSPYTIEVQKSDFPLLATYCDVLLHYDKCKRDVTLGTVIQNPGCYVVWYIDGYYTTEEICTHHGVACRDQCQLNYQSCIEKCKSGGGDDKCKSSCSADEEYCIFSCVE